MNYIQLHVPKPISRRTYYNLRKKIYKNCSNYFNDINNDKSNDAKRLSYGIVIEFNLIKSKMLISYILNIEKEN
jgi:hypothetical protein